jgi:FtsP/CotA-like multicopper oxidase with cupredoxin domain
MKVLRIFFISPGWLLVIALIFEAMSATVVWSRVVEYDLDIDYKTVNFTGRERQALAVNNQIPGPTLIFTEGDHAIIRVHNKLDEETSVHWHGILLPNQYDGVPYVTTMPIEPGGTHTFTFDLRQAGTYWYHSHTNLQEQRGIYGPIVIYPEDDKTEVDHDIVLLLSDWTDENPYEVLRTLKRGSDWYSIKKGVSQSWDQVIDHGAVIDRLKQSFKRMPPMDVSDVYYDRFLINGRPLINLDGIKAGEKTRLRVINGATSTYFNLQSAAGPLTIISADGKDVQPVKADRILIAVAETYDFIFTLPGDGSYELRATAQDGSGHASTFIGRGKKIMAPDMPEPDLFKMMGMMDMQQMGDMGKTAMDGREMSMDTGINKPMVMSEKSPAMPSMQGMDTDMPSVVLEGYGPLRSTVSTRLPDGNPTREITLELTGNMDRYVWSFNDITLSEADKILIRRGENVRFKLINRTMMHHPMHLHGHFFRVLNGQGDYAPLKHTVDVAPMATTTIEFLADEDKDWFFHCHILYHMAAGMARVVHYEGSVIDPALAEAHKKSPWEMKDDDFFFWGEVGISSNLNQGELLFSNTRNSLGVDWDSGWEGSYEIVPAYRRYMGRFLSAFAGADISRDEEGERNELGIIGFSYVLPFYIEGELRYDSDNDWRIELGSEIQLLPRLFLNWTANTDEEWRYGLEWVVNKQLSVTVNHDSDYDAGAGIMVRF